jgi:hypothetical protein
MLIGISGPIGSGKDTVADYLVSKYGFERKSFAAALKKLCSLLTDLPLEIFETRDGKASKVLNQSMTAGQLLQKLGNGLREAVHPNVWCDAVLNDYKDQYWVISDLRYPNELAEIKRLGGIVIRLEGDPEKIREKNIDGRDLNASSETALNDAKFDYVIINNKSKTDLYKIIDDIVILHLPRN